MIAATLVAAAVLSLSADPIGLRICKNSVCRKAGSADTLDSLFALAATSDQANSNQNGEVVLATLQEAFAASHVQACGCLGGCGSGPNVVTTDGGPSDVFHNVYKPSSCAALLDHVGVTVPEAAQRAWLRRMYAMRALRSNKGGEALALLTEALQEASSLKGRAAHLLTLLLEQRADVHEMLRDAPSARDDRERAARLRAMPAPVA